MMRLNSLALVAVSVVSLAGPFGETRLKAGGPRVLEKGKLPADSRLGPQRTYNDA